VRAVFRCVASRNRERGPLGPGTKPPSPPSGPNPLGENQSLSSPPLKPRGLLLSVMRQKVGKERSQGVFAPLANPHRFLACPLRKFDLAPTPLRLCKTPVGVPSGTRPRATATEATVCCRASAKADTVGRLPFQRMPVPTSYTSPPVGSTRRAAITVRTVFSCVASRNTQRMSYWGSLSRILNRACRPAGLLPRAGIKPSGRAGPSPLGENQSLSSPPLEPRGLLLSVMRQKVGKDRSQEVFAPLTIPPTGQRITNRENSALRPPP
jgi:hypothetical protein